MVDKVTVEGICMQMNMKYTVIHLQGRVFVWKKKFLAHNFYLRDLPSFVADWVGSKFTCYVISMLMALF